MELSNEALVQQAVGLNDLGAFEQLVRRHQPRILMLQRRFSGDRALAEDLSQETFLQAWRKLDSFRGTGRFSAWLAKLAYNVFLQHVRKTGDRQQDISIDDQATAELAMPQPGNIDELADLPRLLSVLSYEQQLVIVLNYGHGLSNTEISQVLGIAPGTVKSQIHRAKDKIRQRFNIVPSSGMSVAGSARCAQGAAPGGIDV